MLPAASPPLPIGGGAIASRLKARFTIHYAADLHEVSLTWSLTPSLSASIAPATKRRHCRRHHRRHRHVLVATEASGSNVLQPAKAATFCDPLPMILAPPPASPTTPTPPVLPPEPPSALMVEGSPTASLLPAKHTRKAAKQRCEVTLLRGGGG
jgi:hypothetical protein